jgi:hypothetical protein
MKTKLNRSIDGQKNIIVPVICIIVSHQSEVTLFLQCKTISLHLEQQEQKPFVHKEISIQLHVKTWSVTESQPL